MQPLKIALPLLDLRRVASQVQHFQVDCISATCVPFVTSLSKPAKADLYKWMHTPF